MLRSIGALLVVACLAFVVPAWRAGAHAAFITAAPAPDAVLEAPPAVVRIVFSEMIMHASTITVIAPDGSTVGGPTVVEDNVAYAEVQAGMPGVYQVQWSNVSAEDGHESSGAFQFTVAEPAAVAEAGGAA